jgi:hypothetical protein
MTQRYAWCAISGVHTLDQHINQRFADARLPLAA